MRCLYALARQALHLEAFKVARFALDKLQVVAFSQPNITWILAFTGLQSMLVPAPWRDQLDLATLHVQSKPFADADTLVPVCYRCGAPNALVTAPATGKRAFTQK